MVCSLLSIYSVYDFSREMFLILHSINWQNFIVWLTLLLEVLGNIYIAIVYFPGCDVINFEIRRIFLIKPFFYISKYSRQKFKYLENEKSFWGEIKSIFIIFKGLSVPKTCLRPESGPLNVLVHDLINVLHYGQSISYHVCVISVRFHTIVKFISDRLLISI